MNVLYVVAHPDDEVLGVDGTLARHAAEGDRVHDCVLSDDVGARHGSPTYEMRRGMERRHRRAKRGCDRLGVDTVSFHDFPDNQFDSVPLLDLVQTAEAEIETRRSEIVYTLHSSI